MIVTTDLEELGHWDFLPLTICIILAKHLVQFGWSFLLDLFLAALLFGGQFVLNFLELSHSLIGFYQDARAKLLLEHLGILLLHFQQSPMVPFYLPYLL